MTVDRAPVHEYFRAPLRNGPEAVGRGLDVRGGHDALGA
jgi:hypothetical protein